MSDIPLVIALELKYNGLSCSIPIWVLILLSAVITIIHTLDEYVAKLVPIWEYLGLTDNWWVGFGLLWLFAFLQISLVVSGYWPLLIFIRIADVLFSHWIPWLGGNRPNPGINTSWLYVLDAFILSLVLGRN